MGKALGRRLRKARLNKGLTQIQVMELTNIHNKTLSGYENGVSEPDLETLKILACLYNVSIDDLLADELTPYENNYEAKQAFRDAVKDDPELLSFWLEAENREDLKLLFQQVKKLSPEALRDVIKYARFVEMEERKE